MIVALALQSDAGAAAPSSASLIYIPTLQPSLIIALIWTFVMHPDFGILNVDRAR